MTTTIRRERILKSIDRIKQRALEVREEQESNTRKKGFLELYSERYGIHLSPREQLSMKIRP